MVPDRITHGIKSLLSDPVPDACCIPALPSCLADRNQENSAIACKQHAGWRPHHPPPLRRLFR